MRAPTTDQAYAAVMNATDPWLTGQRMHASDAASLVGDPTASSSTADLVSSIVHGGVSVTGPPTVLTDLIATGLAEMSLSNPSALSSLILTNTGPEPAEASNNPQPGETPERAKRPASKPPTPENIAAKQRARALLARESNYAENTSNMQGSFTLPPHNYEATAELELQRLARMRWVEGDAESKRWAVQDEEAARHKAANRDARQRQRYEDAVMDTDVRPRGRAASRPPPQPDAKGPPTVPSPVLPKPKNPPYAPPPTAMIRGTSAESQGVMTVGSMGRDGVLIVNPNGPWADAVPANVVRPANAPPPKPKPTPPSRLPGRLPDPPIFSGPKGPPPKPGGSGLQMVGTRRALPKEESLVGTAKTFTVAESFFRSVQSTRDLASPPKPGLMPQDRPAGNRWVTRGKGAWAEAPPTP